ncbi:MAG: tetratricopeptide repeat protein [Streptosporangiales bacterium]|nr:tetratricopeptide repeat protein [Streptosporangiales bacterium]
MLLLGHGQVMVPQRERVSAMPARWRHHTLEEHRWERTVDWRHLCHHAPPAAPRTQPAGGCVGRRTRRHRELRCGNWPEALATFDRVISTYGDDPTPKMRGYVATALYDRGLTLSQTGDTDEARARFEQLVRTYAHDTLPDAKQRVADAREQLRRASGEVV